uniref:ADP-ribosylation factor-like protein 2-binding protein n=1 Tax=Romanomermis culicivorax TaxID=13658 RepID=A0A915JCQ2_ROMCU
MTQKNVVEILAFHRSNSESIDEVLLDKFMASLERALFSPEFEVFQMDFFAGICDQFDENIDENKLEYTAYFRQYVSECEKYIFAHIFDELGRSSDDDNFRAKFFKQNDDEQCHDFDVQFFVNLIQTCGYSVNGQLSDFVDSLTDFAVFRDEVLAHKRDTQNFLLIGVKL